ncbi:MAG: transglycosylase SLT domain-containing protein [Planctomycetes bacterium]|nr:transglycosylase SLT domain-containing protein [Planctomycetota bacterium]
MKLQTIWLVVLVPAWFAVASAQATAVDPNDIERLLDAIARIESQGDPKAVGDGGRALGAYQIYRVYWEEGTELLGVDWPHRDAADPQKARRVAKAYLLHYGKGKSLVEMARIHNGGPRGCEKKGTLPYVRKILADGSLSSGLLWSKSQ